MNRIKGKRYDGAPKLNMKKVVATIITFIVIIMIIISLKNLLLSDKKNKEVSTLTTYISVMEKGKWGVIDNKGNVVVDINNNGMIIIPNKNKDIFICSYDEDLENETYKTKVINKDGKELLKEYENVEPIENTDTSTVWYEDDVLRYKKNGKYGLINFEGKILVDAIYDNIHALEGVEKSIVLEKDGKKGLFNSNTSEIIIDSEYADITSVTETYENGYIVKTSENKYGIISLDKTKILDTKYDAIRNIAGNDYYVVTENNILEVIDKEGKVILNNGFDSIEEIQADRFVILKDGKYGMIDKTGSSLVNPDLEGLKFSTSDYLIAQKNGKHGIIKSDGTTCVDFMYDSVSYIKSADFFQAEKTNYTTDIYDRNLNLILQEVIISELNIEKGYLRIRKDNDYKYYNFKFEEKSNKEVLPTNTLFLVKENGKYGYENKNGEKVVDCIYDDAKEQNEFGYCAVKKDGVWGALKSDGTVILKPSRNLDDYLYIDFIFDWNRINDLRLNVYTK